jgi:hypothetical protein
MKAGLAIGGLVSTSVYRLNQMNSAASFCLAASLAYVIVSYITIYLRRNSRSLASSPRPLSNPEAMPGAPPPIVSVAAI